MKKIAFAAAFSAAFVMTAGAALANEPLVSVAWATAHLKKPGVVFLDVSTNAAGFAKGHIPGAVFTDYKKDHWRVAIKENGKKVVGMLPSNAHMAKLIGSLGIHNNDHVIIVGSGKNALQVATAARIYWTFKVLGHNDVSLLNGGMVAYTKDKKNPIETGMSKPTPTTFKVALNKSVLATSADLMKASTSGVTIIDSRPSSQYMGFNKSGAVQQFGYVEGATNVPGEWETVNGGGMLRSKASLEKLYAFAGVKKTSGPAITYCNTGHWASLGWFVNSEILGDKSTKMYDGSMAEYTTIPKVKLVRAASFN